MINIKLEISKWLMNWWKSVTKIIWMSDKFLFNSQIEFKLTTWIRLEFNRIQSSLKIGGQISLNINVNEVQRQEFCGQKCGQNILFIELKNENHFIHTYIQYITRHMKIWCIDWNNNKESKESKWSRIIYYINSLNVNYYHLVY